MTVVQDGLNDILAKTRIVLRDAISSGAIVRRKTREQEVTDRQAGSMT
jgi:hypothetical protein